MTAVRVPPLLFGPRIDALGVNAPAINNTTLVIDADGEKIAYVGRFWNQSRSGKTIDGVEFLTGALTDGGAVVTISLQNVLLTSGPPARPDEGTALASLVDHDLGLITASAWNGVDFSDSEAVSYGQLLAVVFEFGTGGASASIFRVGALMGNGARHESQSVLKTAGSWAAQSHLPDVVFRCSDGSFGFLAGSWPCVSVNTHTFNSGSSPDEIAVGIQLDGPVTVDAYTTLIDLDGDTDVVLYSGTTALQTTSMDTNTGGATQARWTLPVPFPAEQDLAAATLYRLAIKPSTTTNMSAYSLNVNDAAHLDIYSGQVGHYWDRVNAGAWSNENTTRVPLLGLVISKISDGAGAGGGGIIGRSLIAGAA